MTVRMRSARASFDGRASNGVARLHNQLALADHAMFAAQRAVGQELMIQCVWVLRSPSGRRCSTETIRLPPADLVPCWNSLTRKHFRG